jgi:predicted nucleic acid-binding protein
MKAVFADTFYFLALLNERDATHARAVSASRTPGLRLVTTEFVLLELADALCKPGQREEALALWNLVRTDPAFQLFPASSELVEGGRELYRERRDKEWSLTYCTSFVVMQEEQLTDALTGDRHFEQAGFKALLA